MTKRREPDLGRGPIDRVVYDLTTQCPVCGMARNSKAHRAKAARCARIKQARWAAGKA